MHEQGSSLPQALRGTIIGAALQGTPEQKEIRLLKNMVTDLAQQNSESEKEIIANLRSLASANYDTAEEAFERIIAGLENISKKVYMQGFWTKTPYEPTIIPAVKALHGTISKRQIVYNAQIEESRKRQEAAAQPKPVIDGEPTLADVMRKMSEMDSQHKADAAKTQQALQVAGQALNQVKEQLGYMTDASAQALLALPSNVRTVALAATGGQDSQFALAIRDRLAAAETSEPKNDLNTLLTPVYSAAQGQNNIRFRIRFVQFLLRLYPRTLFLSVIIQKATKLFSAIGLSFEELDLVDGHLRDFQFKKDNINNTQLTQHEISDFCEFARDADFGFDEETVRSFSTINFNKTSEIEGVEKKIRLQLIRNFAPLMSKQWLSEKHHAIHSLIEHYKAHSSKGVEALVIKSLIFQLLLHKNDLTINAIVKKARELFESKQLKFTPALIECLDGLNQEDELNGQPISALECEIFDAMLSRKPTNLWLRSDPAAQQMFEELSQKPEAEMLEAVRNAEARYERNFLTLIQQSTSAPAPRKQGTFKPAATTAPLQEQQQALATAAAAVAQGARGK